MTATDELRRMLDERGVEWRRGFGDDTLWTGRHGIEWRLDKQEGALAMCSHAITPAQAIEATLGRGTCHDESGGDPCVFVCSCCGFELNHPEDEAVRFCPNCGRRVVAGDAS